MVLAPINLFQSYWQNIACRQHWKSAPSRKVQFPKHLSFSKLMPPDLLGLTWLSEGGEGFYIGGHLEGYPGGTYPHGHTVAKLGNLAHIILTSKTARNPRV